jgi:hypothetical protein
MVIRGTMSNTYFEPESIRDLVKTFAEAKRRLRSSDTAMLDIIAHRILRLAADGMSPSMILHEIAPTTEADLDAA